MDRDGGPPRDGGEPSEEELEERARQSVAAWKRMAAKGGAAGPVLGRARPGRATPGPAAPGPQGAESPQPFSIVKMVLVCVGFPVLAMLLLGGALLLAGGAA